MTDTVKCKVLAAAFAYTDEDAPHPPGTPAPTRYGLTDEVITLAADRAAWGVATGLLEASDETSLPEEVAAAAEAAELRRRVSQLEAELREANERQTPPPAPEAPTPPASTGPEPAPAPSGLTTEALADMTVARVKDHLEAYPDEVELVRELEIAGRNRQGVLELTTG